MNIFQRINPYNDIEPSFPVLSYLARHVRGGRSPAGAVAMGRRAALILSLVVLIPFVLLMFYEPRYSGSYFRYQNAAWYGGVITAIAIFAFPIIDFFTVFFAVNSVRADLQDEIKFDLLRASLINPQQYVDTRVALARLRSWRIFIFMWVARLIAAVYLTILGLVGLGIAVFEESGFNIFDDPELYFALSIFLMGALIFLVQLIAEPLWRLDLLTMVGVSAAARTRSATGAWLGVGLGVFGVYFFQALLSAGVIWLAVANYEITENLVDVLFPRAYDLQDMMGITMGVIPYAVMPLVVWASQRAVRRWRYRTAVQHIFKFKGGDA